MTPLGGTRRRDIYNKGIDYKFSLLVTDAELSTYWLDLGSDITSLQDDEAGPIYCYHRIKVRHSTAQWKITYYGISSINDYTFTLTPSKKNWSYSTGEFRFTPDMLGVKRAGAADVGKLRLKDSAPCTEGDYIYLDATTSDIGSWNLTDSPVTFSATTELVSFALANSFPTTIYTITYRDIRTSAANFATWIGVNGDFGSAQAPSPSTTAYWKAKNATLRTQTNGIYMTRVMETGPIIDNVYSVWKASKFGTWTW